MGHLVTIKNSTIGGTGVGNKYGISVGVFNAAYNTGNYVILNTDIVDNWGDEGLRISGFDGDFYYSGGDVTDHPDAGVAINDCSGITLDNLDVYDNGNNETSSFPTGAPDAGIRIRGSSGIVISNSSIYTNHGFGLAFGDGNPGDDITVTGCVIGGSSYSDGNTFGGLGVGINNSTTNRGTFYISNNDIAWQKSNYQQTTYYYSSAGIGFTKFAGVAYIDNNLFSHNDAYGTGIDKAPNDIGGYDMKGGTINIGTNQGNTMKWASQNLYTGSISFNSGYGQLNIANNYMSDNAGNNITIRLFNDTDPSGVGELNIYNNTVTNSGSQSIDLLAPGGKVTISNNTVSDAPSSGIHVGCMLTDCSAYNPTNDVYIYSNDVYDIHNEPAIGVRKITSSSTVKIIKNKIHNNDPGGTWSVVGMTDYARLIDGTLIIADNDIYNNVATVAAGIGLRNVDYSGRVTIERNKIHNNSSGFGIGLRDIYGSNTVTIRNNFIYENTGSSNGYGIHLDYYNNSSARPWIYNNTLYGNRWGIYKDFGSPAIPTIINNIIWNSTTDDLYNVTATYSNISDGDFGTGNINCDPQFANVATDNYHIKDTSPCIDNGTTLAQVPEDIDGETRAMDGPNASPPGCTSYGDTDTTPEYDIGADEFGPPGLLGLTLSDQNQSGNPDPEFTNGQTVSVTIDYIGLPNQMILCEASDFSGCSWVSFASPTTFTLGDTTNELKTVYVKIKDDFTQSSSMSDTITFDNIAPTKTTSTLLDPNGGETWEIGTQHDILWNTSDISDANLKANPIKLQYKKGCCSTNDIASDLPNNGTYNWTIPDDAYSSNRVYITIYDKAGNSAQDWSNGYFAIAAPSGGYFDFESGAQGFTVDSPAGYTDWEVGTPETRSPLCGGVCTICGYCSTGNGGPEGAYGGNNAFGTDLDDLYKWVYNQPLTYLYSPTFNMQGKSSATVTYYEWIESYRGWYHMLRLEYQTYNGGPWTVVIGAGNEAQQWVDRIDSSWSQATYVINAGFGSATRFRWKIQFQGSSSFRQQFAGWYIDNVDISSQ
jgi:hypothetical protein